MEQNQGKDKSQFEEQRKDLDKEKDGAIMYEMKNVEGESKKSIREAIAEQSNDPNSNEITDQKQNKEFLDKEKAAYLFDANEISDINKDLDYMNKHPYGLDEEYLDLEYVKFLENNQGTLEKVLEEGYDNEKLITAAVTFENIKDNSVKKLKIVEDPDKKIKEKITKKITEITSELANQKGLSKIWTIKERFGIEEDKDITEEKAFHKESQKVDDIFYKSYRIFKEGYKYTIPQTCPLCKSDKKIKFLFFKIKCPRCYGVGTIQVDPEEYAKKLTDTQKTEIQEKRNRTLIFEDQKSVNF